MKLTIVGGGGFRVPLVYTALLRARDRLGLQEVVLHDVEQSRLDRIAPVLSGLAIEHGVQLPFRDPVNVPSFPGSLHEAISMIKQPRYPVA